MGKIPKKQSKRLLVKDKNKIARKVRQHHKKQRREAKKNPNKFKHKDPGIPNSWPFKQELLAEIEAGRESERAMHERVRAHKEKLRLRATNQKAARAQQAQPSAKQLLEGAAKSTVDSAHVLVLCLDARDPPAGRCAQLERLFATSANSAKALIMLLNNAHLVPAHNLASWLEALRSEGVCAVPLCMTVDPAVKTSSRQKALKAVGTTELCELLARIALADGLVPHDGLLKVAVSGAPNSGSADVLHCMQLRLKKKGPARGHVAVLDAHVPLEPKLAPEGGLPLGNPTAGVLTFGLRPSRKATDLVQLAAVRAAQRHLRSTAAPAQHSGTRAAQHRDTKTGGA
jgi:nuclear GTP-binding protein